MKQVKATLGDLDVLHLRPAAVICKIARSFPHTRIWLRREASQDLIDATSVVELVLAAFRRGERISIQAQGQSAELAARAIQITVENLNYGRSDQFSPDEITTNIYRKIDAYFAAVGLEEIEDVPEGPESRDSTQGETNAETAIVAGIDIPQNDKHDDYDVALSFAGEDRTVAQQLAERLRQLKIRVFYDKFEKSRLWGKNLSDHLYEIYSKRSLFCIILVSKYYLAKPWTTHERKAAQERMLKGGCDCVLPIKLDASELPGCPSTISYLDFREVSINEIVELFLEKLIESYPDRGHTIGK